MELDLSQLKGRIAQAAVISNASVALPMILGMAAAVPVYRLVAPDREFVAFALFMGVAMSITAFPVLARILVERRMLTRPVGALTMAAAAIDDVTAWFLIALALAVAVAGTPGGVIETISLACAFAAVMFLAVGRCSHGSHRPTTRSAGCRPAGSQRYSPGPALRLHDRDDRDRSDLRRIPDGDDHAASRRADRGRDRQGRGLRRHPAAPAVFRLHGPANERRPAGPARALADDDRSARDRDRSGSSSARCSSAAATGFGWRPSAVIGTLMNTRGLTELIVLNIALEKG